ncbi:MAG: lysophospholipid acyltransferase family protein [Dehalococcoidia bacterium]
MLAFYILATGTMKSLLISFTRWHVIGKENVPKNGPIIVVSNHLNLPDPPLLSASIPRRLFFMAKEELFSSKGRAFVSAFGAFPVRRGIPDRDAIRQATKIIESDNALCMFPEGKRSPDHRMGKAEFGSALIALRSGAPVLPVGISGSEQIDGVGLVLQRPRITVNIGKPFSFPKSTGKLGRERLIEVTDHIMYRIAELLPKEYRGVYDS